MSARVGLLVLVMAALGWSGAATAQGTIEERLAPGQPPVIIAQRALGGGYPENSLAGIQHAIDHGVDMVKIDIQLTRDDRHVLIHDLTLNRTTNVHEVFPERAFYVRRFTVPELKTLRLRDGEDGGDHKIPTLDEALDLIGSDILVAIGLKTYDLDTLVATLAARPTDNYLLFFAEPGATQPLVDAVAATGIPVFAGVSQSGNYADNLVRLADALGPDFALMGLARKGLTPELADIAAARGVALSIFGLRGEDYALAFENNPAEWLEALDSGASAMLTAHPVEVLELRAR